MDKKRTSTFKFGGILAKINIPQISLNFGHIFFIERIMHDISAKIFKTFISGQKSTSKFKIGGKRKMKKENRKEKEKKS